MEMIACSLARMVASTWSILYRAGLGPDKEMEDLVDDVRPFPAARYRVVLMRVRAALKDHREPWNDDIILHTMSKA